MSNEFKVFYFDRAVQPCDIAEALVRFGKTPVTAVLNPLCSGLAQYFSQDTVIDYRAGCSKMELWLADQFVYPEEKPLPVNPSGTRETPYNLPEPVSIIVPGEQPESSSRRGRGRPRLTGPYLSRTTLYRRSLEGMKKTEALPI